MSLALLRRPIARACAASASRTLMALATLSLASGVARAQTASDSNAKTFAIPAWAFPSLGSATAPSATGTDTAAVATLPTSRVTFTVGRTRDRYDVADWNPGTHPAPPAFVLHGRKPAVMACGFCHLADGRGRPENAMIAGLPVDYFMQQVKDMRTRARHTGSPVPFASALLMSGNSRRGTAHGCGRVARRASSRRTACRGRCR